MMGNIENASYLIDKGAELNIRSVWGATPLHLAASRNGIEAAKLLLKKGANLNALDNHGETQNCGRW